jgi:hypothetical protein
MSKHRLFFLILTLLVLNFHSSLFAQTSFNAGGVNGGAIVVGASTTNCSGAMVGGMRWSTTNSCMEICAGSTWACAQISVCGNNLPSSFTFNNQTNVAVSTLISSNIVQVTGITGCTVEVSVTGSGTPEYRVCSDATCTAFTQDWTSSKSSLVNNQYVQMRLTSNSSGAVTSNASLTVGARSVGWSVTTTGDCTAPSPPLGTFCADGTVYVGLSPDGGVKMYATPCSQGRIWNGSSCTGTSTTIKWSEKATVATGVTNSTTGEANTTTLAGLSNADSPYGPAQICNNLVFGGQSDWYLPSTGEASILQAACGVTPDLSCSGGYQHTSRESSASDMFAWRTTSNNIIGTWKENLLPFRCVRKD